MHKLKAWFFPHRQNHFHPHALRPIGLSFFIAVLLLTNLSYNFVEAKKIQVLGYATSISTAEVIALSNNERTSRGLGALATNSALNAAALAKANHMIANDYWAHVAPDGTTPWDFMTAAGYAYYTAGENLAMGFMTSSGVVTGWMNSPGHRANILNDTFAHTGVAAVNGVLQGQETTLVVAMYGSTGPVSPPPAPAPVPEPAPPPPAPAPTPAPSTTAPVSQTPTSTPTESQPAAEQAEPKAEAVPVPDQDPINDDNSGAEAAPVEATGDESDNESVARTRAFGSIYVPELSVQVKEQLNWAQSVSVFMLSMLLLLNVLKHTVVWRTHRKGWRHIWMRSHPLAQAALIAVALVVNVSSGAGVIL